MSCGLGTYRCSRCGISWPADRRYRMCAQCEERCDLIADTPNITDAAAWSLWSRCRFERFYRTRCERRGVPVTGPLPEEAA